MALIKEAFGGWTDPKVWKEGYSSIKDKAMNMVQGGGNKGITTGGMISPSEGYGATNIDESTNIDTVTIQIGDLNRNVDGVNENTTLGSLFKLAQVRGGLQ